MAPDLDGKRLELLKEAFPKVTRVAFLWNPGSTRGNRALTEMEAAAKALGLKLLSLEVRGLDDFEGAFARAKRDAPRRSLRPQVRLITTQQRQVLDFAAKNRLPAMYPNSEFVEAGGLMSYAPNYTDLWRRAADLRRQDFERRQARRPSRRAADEVRVRHQSEDREADRPDDSAERAGAGGQGDQRGAGINRHGVADERAAQERSSAPFWLRVMRLGPKGRGRSVDRGTHRPGMELRNHHFGVPTLF